MDRFFSQFLPSNPDTAETTPPVDPMNDQQPDQIITRSRSANLAAPTATQEPDQPHRSPSPALRDRFTFEVQNRNTMADQTVQALTAALQGMKVSSRKPDLPAFDSKNIDIWLKRVDNAYRRSGVTDPKDKFAFIEPKFAVDFDPRINEFLFGDGTADEWDAFEAYLRGRYGRTKSQQNRQGHTRAHKSKQSRSSTTHEDARDFKGNDVRAR